MSVLVLQHVSCEGLGLLAEVLEERGLAFEVVELWKGQAAPDRKDRQGLVVLGGPMNVYEDKKYPSIAEVDQAIRRALVRGIPILGICLGAQLLAKSLGAAVRRNPLKEIGMGEVTLTWDGRASGLFQGLPSTFPVFQWHGDTFDIPSGAERLAFSGFCRNQALHYGERAYGLQFHLETTPEMVEEWVDIYREELAEEGLSGEAIWEDFRAAYPTMRAHFRQLAANFLDQSELIALRQD